MREQFERVNDPRSEAFTLAPKLNLPTSYLLIHRTWLGAIGLLSQLDATAPFREILEESLPGFGDGGSGLDPLPRRLARGQTCGMVATTSDALAERLFGALLGTVDMLSIFLGDRLGWYRSLVDDGPATASELAERTGTHARYAREWLEQQAVTGLLTVETDGDADTRRFAIPAATAEVLTDTTSLNYLAPFGRMFAAVGPSLPHLLEAYRTGGGVSWEQLGADAREAQADGNRPWYDSQLGPALAGVPHVHGALSRPGVRILDVGCGGGWSSIALKRAYPAATVTGIDVDAPSIELARANAASAGVDVDFRHGDAADLGDASYDVAFAFECVHDMPRPVEVLGAVHRALTAERIPRRDGRGGGRLLRAGRRRDGADHVRLQPARLPARRHVQPAQRRHRDRHAAVGAARVRPRSRVRRPRGAADRGLRVLAVLPADLSPRRDGTMARMDAAAALARWHAVVESRDPAGLPGLVAEDAVFRSPAVHTPQVGRDTVVGYLTAAFTVLGPALTYEREWLGDDSAVLQFRTRSAGSTSPAST